MGQRKGGSWSTSETRARAVELRQSGCPIREIARMLGVTVGAVSKWTRAYYTASGDAPPFGVHQEKRYQQRREKARHLWRTSGMTLKQIGDECGVGESTAHYYIHERRRP